MNTYIRSLRRPNRKQFCIRRPPFWVIKPVSVHADLNEPHRPIKHYPIPQQLLYFSRYRSLVTGTSC